MYQLNVVCDPTFRFLWSFVSVGNFLAQQIRSEVSFKMFCFTEYFTSPIFLGALLSQRLIDLLDQIISQASRLTSESYFPPTFRQHGFPSRDIWCKTSNSCTFKKCKCFYFFLSCFFGCELWWWCCGLGKKRSAKSGSVLSKLCALILSNNISWGFKRTERSEGNDEVAICSSKGISSLSSIFSHFFVTVSENFFE